MIFFILILNSYKIKNNELEVKILKPEREIESIKDLYYISNINLVSNKDQIFIVDRSQGVLIATDKNFNPQYLINDKVVWVRVNDRLPQNSKRIIDLSKAAATEIEMINDGLAKVKIEVPDQGTIQFLMDHYQDNIPEDIRLRIYEEPIFFEKMDLCMIGFEMDLGEKVEVSI